MSKVIILFIVFYLYGIGCNFSTYKAFIYDNKNTELVGNYLKSNIKKMFIPFYGFYWIFKNY